MNRPHRIRHRQTLSVKQTRRSADQRRSHGRTTQASIHVLFVARLRSLRDAVAYFTRLLGYTVRTVDSVASALIVLRRTPVDIVVVEEEQDVPVLLMTLHAQGRSEVLVIVIALVMTTEDAARWSTMGLFHCIPKPFDLRTYRHALAHATTEIHARRK